MFAWLMEILTHMFYFTGYIRSQSFARPLSREDEERCLAALQKGDAYARDQLIEHNLRLVAHIVKKYYAVSTEQDELLSISRRSGKIIFSHETALFLHGISDRTPFEHTVTAPSGCIPSAAIKAECKVYYIKPELFELGKTMLQTPAGNPVPCYDLERTICDVIRSRNKIGTETFLSALKQYAASPKKDLNRLDDYARQMRVSGVLRQYLEVLL